LLLFPGFLRAAEQINIDVVRLNDQGIDDRTSTKRRQPRRVGLPIMILVTFLSLENLRIASLIFGEA